MLRSQNNNDFSKIHKIWKNEFWSCTIGRKDYLLPKVTSMGLATRPTFHSLAHFLARDVSAFFRGIPLCVSVSGSSSSSDWNAVVGGLSFDVLLVCIFGPFGLFRMSSAGSLLYFPSTLVEI